MSQYPVDASQTLNDDAMVDPRELAEILLAHKEWLDSKGQPAKGKRANLNGYNLEGTCLKGQNLSKARLRGAILCDLDLRGVDFAQADLTDADLTGAKLHFANLQDATLQSTNLAKAEGLSLFQLAGASMPDATLPEHIQDFASLTHFNDLASHNRTIFYILTSACAYSLLTVATVSDAELLIGAQRTSLPIVGASVSITHFFYIASAILLFIYLYFQLCMQWMWDEMSHLPAVFPDGRSVIRSVFPWLPIGYARGFLRTYRSAAAPPPLWYIEAVVSNVAIWGITPLTILCIWWRFLPSSHLGGLLFLGTLLILSFAGSVIFFQLAKDTLYGEFRKPPLDYDPQQSPHGHPTDATSFAIIDLSLESLKSENVPDDVLENLECIKNKAFTSEKEFLCVLESNIGSQLTAQHKSVILRHVADVSMFPLPRDLRLRRRFLESGQSLVRVARFVLFLLIASVNIRKAGSSRHGRHANLYAPGFILGGQLGLVAAIVTVALSLAAVLPAPDAHLPLISTFVAFKENWLAADLSNFKIPTTSGKTTRGINLSDRNLNHANLRGLDLTRADLRNTTLTGVHLSRAILIEARLNRAHLASADLNRVAATGAVLDDTNLKESNLVGANFDGATFQGAQLERAILSKASFKGADFARAELQYAELHGSKLQKANLAFAILTGANFYRTNLKDATLTCACWAKKAPPSLFEVKLSEPEEGTEHNCQLPTLKADETQCGLVELAKINKASRDICSDDYLQQQQSKYDTDRQNTLAFGNVRQGKKVFRVCARCHEDDKDNQFVPPLTGVIGRRAGWVHSFKRYSRSMEKAGFIWNAAQLHDYIENPNALVPKNKMFRKGFRGLGLHAQSKISDLLAFLYSDEKFRFDKKNEKFAEYCRLTSSKKNSEPLEEF